ncbi:DUF397 domain-containing protein [Streptomyces avicenniae]|uniref:DUF397 domain-containing protein n=1 Tax=Streptomyces avicenniae TaxID=500153 RepID=UPI000DA631A2|nr:DUF397 domain-containing protein [Streptomyces avicenniae]
MSSSKGVRWRVSSYSNGEGQCVEVARCATAVGARDTKDTGHGPELWTSCESWAAFVGSVRRGSLEG